MWNASHDDGLSGHCSELSRARRESNRTKTAASAVVLASLERRAPPPGRGTLRIFFFLTIIYRDGGPSLDHLTLKVADLRQPHMYITYYTCII